MKRLNLGSNDIKYKNCTNVDIRDIKGVDIVDNVMVLSKVKDNEYDEIIAHNILEHIAPDKCINTLQVWVSKLKEGGQIEIGVPDIEMIFYRYKNKSFIRRSMRLCTWEDFIHSALGNFKIMRAMHGDEAEKYMHNNLFNQKHLEDCMTRVGLKDIFRVKSNHPDCITLRGVK